MVIQVFVSTIAILSLLAIVKRARRGAIRVAEAVGWGALWAGAIVVVWNPLVSNRLASWLGVGRGADAVMYSAMVIVLYTVLRLYARIETIEHGISELVKKTALDQAKEDIERAANRVREEQQ